MSDAGLVERFRTLWGRMAPAGGGLEVGGRVLAAYEEPHRHYHGVEHLRDCLSQLDAAPATRADRDLAETALWFHDAVYDPRASDNEARSAEWAERALSDAGAPEPRAREVGRLIRLTDHARPPGDPAGALVCDVDLSVLGRPTAEFDEYERRVRAEYDWVPEPLSREARATILTWLLAREPLYGSEHFRSLYEKAARRNLERSLGRLRPEGRAE